MKKIKSLFTLFSLILLFPLSGNAGTCAACNPPNFGSWFVTSSCELSSSTAIRGNIFIQNNAVLTILSGADLIIDLSVNRIEVEDGAQLIVKNGAKIQNIMVGDTDGRFGYYLKRVNGPVLQAYNEDIPFYPASTIKVLQHVHAMRAVELGQEDVSTTMVTVCSDNNTNCSNNPNSFVTCQNTTPVVQTLATTLNRMMVNSDNQDTNAIQEFFGNGNAANGRTAINNTGYNLLGISTQTALQHKLACGNISNNPFNTATLEDLAEIYEEVGEDDNILSGSAKASFYSLMINQSFDSFFTLLTDIVDEENGEIGLSAFDLSFFKSLMRTARKAGNVTCCFSNAGWVQLPTNNGGGSVQYVMGLFFDSFTFQNVSMTGVQAEMMRGPIREAMETWN